MSSNSSMPKLSELRISRDEARWLVIGITVGLVLGLLIGWVWWPVDWQGGSISSFSKEDQVSYLSAVADAYAPYSSPEALADASERLAALGGDRDKLIQDAIDFYSTQPDGSIQAANLTALASALASSAELPAPQAELTQPAPETAAAVATPEQSDAQTSDSGWGGIARVLALLAGLALIGFGGYALWMLAKGRTLGGGDSGTAPPQPVSAQPAAASSRSTISGYDPSQAERASSSYAQAQANATRVPPVQPTAGAATTPFDHEEAIDDAVTTFAATPPPAATVMPERAAPSPERTAPVTPPFGTGANHLDRYPTIDQHTAEFFAGMENFDYSKSIPGGPNNYLGEYGIGISERHGVLNSDRDQVVAMEIYLFDKSDETQLVDVNRVLLSEYAHDHLLKHFERDKERFGPIVAQRNTVFELGGRQLVLKCNVRDVQYSPDGIFQRLVVDMELKKKG